MLYTVLIKKETAASGDRRVILKAETGAPYLQARNASEDSKRADGWRDPWQPRSQPCRHLDETLSPRTV